MPKLVNQLADLSALRDRQSLDQALVDTLQDLLEPLQLAIYRRVGPSHDAHWLTCAGKQDGRDLVLKNNAWADLESLPKADDFAARQQVIQSKTARLAERTGELNIFPLVAQAEHAAVLELGLSTTLSPERVRLVTAILRLYQNFQGLLDYGELDALTELLNRKTFDGAFLKATTNPPGAMQQIDAERRAGAAGECGCGSYWLAMLDIDHFKLVNDNYGHLIGDEVLLLLARLMRNTFRFHDQLYRFGGEEFVVLMRCQEATQAQAALERLRANTEQYAFPQVGKITVSIGFTQVLQGDSPSSAFERADKAVYYAKEHGRNQVCGFENLVSEGKLTVAAANVGDIELF